MDTKYRELIANEFRNCVQGTIYRITRNEQTNVAIGVRYTKAEIKVF